MQDATELNRTGESNRDGEERFRAVFEQAAVGMALVGLDGRWRRINQQLCHLLGYPHEELTGLTFQEITWPGDLGADLAQLERLLAGEIPTYSLEKRYIRKDGSLVWANLTVSLARTAEGRPDYFIAVVEEISRRKEAEEWVRTLADSIPHLCWMADAEGFITWYNRRWVDYTGRDYEQLRGRRWEPVLDPAVQPEVLERWLGCIATGNPFEMEFEIRGRDGDFHPFLTRAEPVRDERGRAVRWFGTGTDISAQKRAEAALQEADRHKNEFLAMLAHELRNPLAPLSSGVQILRLSPDPEVQRQALSLMQRQLDQVVRLVDDLLDVSRISLGKFELRRQPVELREVLNRAVEMSRPLIARMGHELTVTLPEDPLPLDADPARLAQVFANLLNNAAKYTPAGGEIWLSAAVDAQGVEGGGWRVEGPENPAPALPTVVVRVRDTGVGIAAEQLAGIFGLYSQVEGTLDRAQGGIGIGLALVQRLVELHGGTIEARSEGSGKGSEFLVRLPLAAGAPAPAAKESEPLAEGSPLRILIVDDNEDIVRSLGLLLEVMGHQVSTAGDGERGVELAEALRPDLVLLDLSLPRLDGYQACRQIRAQPWGKEMSLVAMTGWGQEEDRRRTQAAGFDQHMVKPVDATLLLKLLAELRVPG